MMRRRVGRFSSRNWSSASLTTVWTGRLDLGVAELVLGLRLELRLEQLDADDRGQALAHVLAGQVGVASLSMPALRA